MNKGRIMKRGWVHDVVQDALTREVTVLLTVGYTYRGSLSAARVFPTMAAAYMGSGILHVVRTVTQFAAGRVQGNTLLVRGSNSLVWQEVRVFKSRAAAAQFARDNFGLEV